MSTPNQPQDPYQSPDGGQGGGQPPYGSSDPAAGPPYGEVPQYGQYGAPQDPAAGQPGAYPAYPSQPYQAVPTYGYPKNNLGVWSLVLGLVGLVVCGFAGIAAIVVGNQSKAAVARGEANNGGMATAGIVMGWVAVGLWILGVVFVVATGILGSSTY